MGGEHGGVLGGSYAVDRAQRPHVRFRLQARAHIAAEAIREHLGQTSGLRVLDLGAAEGKTLVELERMLPGGHFLGVEFSQELLDAADAMPSSIRLLQGDVMALPAEVDDAGYDVVTALALLEHLPDPLRAVREAARVLRPGGLLVASCPDPAWDDIAARLRMLDDDQHEVEMDREGMQRLVEQAGLRVVEFRRFMWSPVATLPYLKVEVPVSVAAWIDRRVAPLWPVNRLCVNQLVVGKKG